MPPTHSKKSSKTEKESKDLSPWLFLGVMLGLCVSYFLGEIKSDPDTIEYRYTVNLVEQNTTNTTNTTQDFEKNITNGASYGTTNK